MITQAPPAEVATANFVIDSIPSRASIYLDDQFQFDYTPSNQKYKLAPGTHIVNLRKKGYVAYEEAFTVAEGETYNKTITMQAL